MTPTAPNDNVIIYYGKQIQCFNSMVDLLPVPFLLIIPKNYCYESSNLTDLLYLLTAFFFNQDFNFQSNNLFKGGY